jgi:hypothetical protein
MASLRWLISFTTRHATRIPIYIPVVIGARAASGRRAADARADTSPAGRHTILSAAFSDEAFIYLLYFEQVILTTTTINHLSYVSRECRQPALSTAFSPRHASTAISPGAFTIEALSHAHQTIRQRIRP